MRFQACWRLAGCLPAAMQAHLQRWHAANWRDAEMAQAAARGGLEARQPISTASARSSLRDAPHFQAANLRHLAGTHAAAPLPQCPEGALLCPRWRSLVLSGSFRRRYRLRRCLLKDCLAGDAVKSSWLRAGAAAAVWQLWWLGVRPGAANGRAGDHRFARTAKGC